MTFRMSGIVLISFFLLGCVADKNQDDQNLPSSLETFNRSMFHFNYNMLDPYVVRPAAILWRDYMPKSVRNGVRNFFSNLEEPTTMTNYFMKKKPYKAMIHFNRFFLNTLLGMGGLIDVASMANPQLAKEEPRRFGSTLGNYGVDYGPYIQLPGYGSFTFRESIGGLVDEFYPFLSYLTWWMSVSKCVLEGLETRAQLLDSDSLLRESQDPYALIRAVYFQRHDFLASDGKVIPKENLSDWSIQDDFKSIDLE